MPTKLSLPRFRRAALALAIIASLTACNRDFYGELKGASDNFGESTRQTFAAQVIDPVPQYDQLVPESSADHAARAADRYRKDTVKRPDQVRTSDLSITGGSGN